ncbi:hypothetical protein NDU88_001185 [Pleurodeles waltl]|uniref:Uncharacterized protein n=1 Tax=Pleurodeles waltl TaxID=8319 RepID=A0AAV7NE14_PLEWA|nr:hypothetical protein NDU88_001185 [Pleurodeles waltl]
MKRLGRPSPGALEVRGASWDSAEFGTLKKNLSDVWDISWIYVGTRKRITGWKVEHSQHHARRTLIQARRLRHHIGGGIYPVHAALSAMK